MTKLPLIFLLCVKIDAARDKKNKKHACMGLYVRARACVRVLVTSRLALRWKREQTVVTQRRRSKLLHTCVTRHPNNTNRPQIRFNSVLEASCQRWALKNFIPLAHNTQLSGQKHPNRYIKPRTHTLDHVKESLCSFPEAKWVLIWAGEDRQEEII